MAASPLLPGLAQRMPGLGVVPTSSAGGLLFSLTPLTSSLTATIAAGSSFTFKADLYGAGGGGAGGGYATGGYAGGGGGYKAVRTTINGPCTVNFVVGAGGAGGAYGLSGSAGGDTYIQVVFPSGTTQELGRAGGGGAGGINPDVAGVGGAGDYVGGTASTFSGGYPAGPRGAGSSSSAGAGNASMPYGAGGAGNSTGSGNSTNVGSPGTSGYIIFV